jgi:DNA-binding MarR family transcriptional regulator
MLSIVPSIHRATHRIGLFLADVSDAGVSHGVSQGEAHILARLWSTERATIAELHADLAHKRSTLTSILDRLTERGYVTREVGEEDRRTFVIRLTPRGAVVARRVDARLRSLERAVASRVSKSDLRAFRTVIAAVEMLAKRSTPAARTRR